MPTIRQLIIGMFLAFFLVLTGCLPHLTDDQQKTLSSLRRVDPYPLYVMDYYGDYHFDDFMKKGEKTYKEWIYFFRTHFPIGLRMGGPIQRDFACTCFSAKNEKGEPVVGRNFDWGETTSMLLFTHPPRGYASVAMVNLSTLGFRKANLAKLPLEYKLRLLLTPYVTTDGMNECGLMVAENRVPYCKTFNDPQKVSMLPEEALRMILDNAKDVNEAIAWLKSVNVVFQWHKSMHIFLADRSGEAAVVEVINGEIVVVRNKEPWLAATNSLLHRVTPEEASQTDMRYDDIYHAMKDSQAVLSETESMELLRQVKVDYTTWSVVYNTVSGRLQVAMGGQYGRVYRFGLTMK